MVVGEVAVDFVKEKDMLAGKFFDEAAQDFARRAIAGVPRDF